MFEVGLVGAGNMGEAMLRGWIESGALQPSEIVVYDSDNEKLERVVGRYSVASAPGNKDAADGATTLVLAVKPKDSVDVLSEIAPVTGKSHTVISIIAGLTLSTIRDRLGGEPSLVRVMPNMAAGSMASMSAYAADSGPDGFDEVRVRALLQAIGEVVEVEEEDLDLVTAVSGSGPAYFFLLVESLEKAAIAGGVSSETAKRLSRETLWGAAKVLKETGRDAAELREAVSSPGGTTIAALMEMERADFDVIIGNAVAAAGRKARSSQGDLILMEVWAYGINPAGYSSQGV